MLIPSREVNLEGKKNSGMCFGGYMCFTVCMCVSWGILPRGAIRVNHYVSENYHFQHPHHKGAM